MSVNNETSLSRADIERAFNAFRANCSPLNGHWSDVERVRITVRPEFADHRLARGWTKSIHIEVVVPENPRLIPSFDRRTGIIAGHTLHYHIGGGWQPGMLATKRAPQMLCGAPISDGGEDTFKAIPELAFLRY